MSSHVIDALSHITSYGLSCSRGCFVSVRNSEWAATQSHVMSRHTTSRYFTFGECAELCVCGQLLQKADQALLVHVGGGLGEKEREEEEREEGEEDKEE